MFGELVRDYTDICALATEGTVTVFAVRNAAGRRALLVIDYGGGGLDLTVNVAGVHPLVKAKCRLLSDGLDGVAYDKIGFADGVLMIRKPDYFSAVALVEFDETRTLAVE